MPLAGGYGTVHNGGVYAYIIHTHADGHSFVVPKQDWSGSEWWVVWTACVWVELVVGVRLAQLAGISSQLSLRVN